MPSKFRGGSSDTGGFHCLMRKHDQSRTDSGSATRLVPGLKFLVPKQNKQNKVVVTVKKAPAKKQKPARTGGPTRVSGRGAYTYGTPGPWGRTGREIGEVLGNHFGGSTGKAIGSKLGSYAHYIGKIFGSGDYKTSDGIMNRNSLIYPEQVPSFGSDPASVRICHREYLYDIVAPPVAGQFVVQDIAINPGLAGSFPWLSGLVGGSFQQYRMNGMIYEFKSTSSEFSVSTNLGFVVIATDYDSTDARFTTKQQMENTQFAVSCKPSENMIHAIECAKSQTSISQQYVRAGAPPANADLRLYDVGRTSIGVGGVSTPGVVLGELWCSYDVSVFKPILAPPGTLVLSAYYPIVLATVATKPALFNTAGFFVDSIGLTNDGFGAIRFPFTIPLASRWSILFYSEGGGAAATQALVTGANGMTALNATYPPAVAPDPSGVAGGKVIMTSQVFRYDGGGTLALPPTLNLSAPATPLPGYTFAYLIITMLNNGF